MVFDGDNRAAGLRMNASQGMATARYGAAPDYRAALGRGHVAAHHAAAYRDGLRESGR